MGLCHEIQQFKARYDQKWPSFISIVPLGKRLRHAVSNILDTLLLLSNGFRQPLPLLLTPSVKFFGDL